MHSTNAFLPLLKNGSTKKILSMSSGLGDLDFTLAGEAEASASYSIAKAALNMVVAKYAAQFKSEGFVFLAMSPGIVDVSGTRESGRQSFLLVIPGTLDSFRITNLKQQRPGLSKSSKC